MDNQTRNELKRQQHADAQAHIIRLRNAEIQALKAEKGRLQRALQERPDTPSEALIERAEKAEKERDEALRRVRRGECAYCTEPLDHTGPPVKQPPRPLTADDITHEMVMRFLNTYKATHGRVEPAVRAGVEAMFFESSRPATLSGVDLDMTHRAMKVLADMGYLVSEAVVADALRAALIEPTRPVTLESIVDEALTEYTGGYLNGDEVGPYVASKYADLADRSN